MFYNLRDSTLNFINHSILIYQPSKNLKYSNLYFINKINKKIDSTKKAASIGHSLYLYFPFFYTLTILPILANKISSIFLSIPIPNDSNIPSAIALASNGGTAFPIC